MKKQILLSPQAYKDFSRLPSARRGQIRSALRQLSKPERQYCLDIKRLKGVGGREDLHRLRVGDYRIIFLEDEKRIMITRIVHRSVGYDWL